MRASCKDIKHKADDTPKKEKSYDKAVKGNWKKKLKSALKTPNGLKNVMGVLAEEDKSNQTLVAVVQASMSPPTALPPAP